MNTQQWITGIENGHLDSKISKLYGSIAVLVQKQRYRELLDLMQQANPEDEVSFFSCPGRTELGGNHIDHNHGRVIAAGVQLDSLAVVSACAENVITLVSEGYRVPFVVGLEDLAVKDEETGTTQSLIRGIAARLKQQGHKIGGFRGFVHSDVLPGSGLSSSASIEVLIATIFNHLYNSGSLTPLEIAQTAQYAENVFFGKPCGLMDQAACAYGGITSLDFQDPGDVRVAALTFNFQEQGYNLVVVDTGGTHADLTESYALIPGEMKSLADVLGQSVCRDVPFDLFLQNIPLLREKLGDRALLRYLHFYRENLRVERQVRLLQEGKTEEYLREVQASGSSSWRWLQNCYEPSNPLDQSLSLSLALTEQFLSSRSPEGSLRGACRVHGGGFAGTIQVYIPNDLLDEYTVFMEQVLGTGTIIPLRIRPEGAIRLQLP